MALSLTGPVRLYPGNRAWFNILGVIDGAPGADRIYLGSVSWIYNGTKTPVASYNLFGGHGIPAYPDGERVFYTIGASSLWLQVLSPDAGSYTLSIAFEASSPEQRAAGTAGVMQTLTIDVVAAPKAGNPLFIPIPNKSLWESTMLVEADYWAPKIIDPESGLGIEAWYYDLPDVFIQISDYIQTNKYMKAALASGKQYADFLSVSGGKCQGYELFARGLRKLWQRTQDDTWLNALLLLKNNPWVQYPGDPDPQYMRETAYALMTLLEFQRIGMHDLTLENGITTTVAAQAKIAAEFLMTHIDLLCRQEYRGAPHQPFWNGLAAEALTSWYEITADPRVFPVLHLMCEYIWANGVNSTTGQVLYNLWVTDPNAEGYGNFSSLNLLMVNAWGFLYRKTGDSIYRDCGDFLFQHFADNEGIYMGNPKGFAQNYWLSFKYVTKYRA